MWYVVWLPKNEKWVRIIRVQSLHISKVVCVYVCVWVCDLLAPEKSQGG